MGHKNLNNALEKIYSTGVERKSLLPIAASQLEPFSYEKLNKDIIKFVCESVKEFLMKAMETPDA